jgi:uncharacterized protein (DUF433 family)
MSLPEPQPTANGPQPEKPVVIETEHGPKIAGTRITIYDVYYYMRKGWHHSSIAGILSLSSREVLEVMRYIEAHRDEVEAVHQQIEERIARGHPPEVQAKLDAIHAKYAVLWADRRRAPGLEVSDEGSPGRR